MEAEVCRYHVHMLMEIHQSGEQLTMSAHCMSYADHSSPVDKRDSYGGEI